MPQAGIQLQGHVPDPRPFEGVVGPPDTGSHIAHRVVLPGDQQDGGVFVHPVDVPGGLIEPQAPQHLAEQAHRGVRAAQGVRHIPVHVVRVGGQPVVGGPGLVAEGLVIGPEGHIRHHLADGVRPLEPGQNSRQQQTAPDGHLRLPAGAHDDGGVHGAGIADQVRPGQERPHAVAHQQDGQIRILLPQPVMEQVDVVHHRLPGAAVAEIHRRAALRQGLAVAQVVVSRHQDAPVVEIPGKIVIPQDMLRHAVGDL